MLRAAQTDTRSTKGDSCGRLVGGVCIGAHFQASQATAPIHHASKIAVSAALFRLHRLLDEHLHHLRGGGGQLAGVHQTGCTIQGEVIALVVHHSTDGNGAFLIVDGHIAHAAHTYLAHLASYQGSVAGKTAASRQNTLSCNHAAQIFRRGFQAHQQHFFAAFSSLNAADGVEVEAPGGGTGSGIEPLGNALGSAQGGIIKDRSKHLVYLVSGDTLHGSFPVDESLALHIAGDAECGNTCTLAIAGLQHVHLAILNRELKVLHIAEVVFERLADRAKLLIRTGHHLCQLAYRLRCTHTGHHVLTLCIHEEFSVELIGTDGGVAGKGYTGAGFVGSVTEHHALHIHSGTPIGGDTILGSVGDGTFVVPGAEHGANSTLELLPGVGGEILSCAAQHQCFESLHQLAAILGSEFCIRNIASVAFLLQGLDFGFKRLHVLTLTLLHPHHHIAIHLHKAAVAVPSKTRIGGG